MQQVAGGRMGGLMGVGEGGGLLPHQSSLTNPGEVHVSSSRPLPSSGGEEGCTQHSALHASPPPPAPASTQPCVLMHSDALWCHWPNY